MEGNRSSYYPSVSGLKLKDFGKARGKGVITTKDIPAGEVVTPYLGDLKPNYQWLKDRPLLRSEGHKHTYAAQYNSSVVIDATKRGNIARFINSSHDPNCTAEKVSSLFSACLS